MGFSYLNLEVENKYEGIQVYLINRIQWVLLFSESDSERESINGSSLDLFKVLIIPPITALLNSVTSVPRMTVPTSTMRWADKER